MSRRKKGTPVHGWINLDKPSDMTSTDALARVRRLFDAQKAGHGGTLDPLATGVLPIALGEATKTIPYCQDAIKAYSFDIVWGEARSTDDAEGDIVATSLERPDPEAIQAALPAFRGDILQVPPRFSAVKIDGRRAYDLARAGAEVELAARPAYIETFDLLDARADKASFRVTSGKGVYMRSLARDLAVSLGTVGHIAHLRREAVGAMTQESAISLAELQELSDGARLGEALMPLATMLDDIPALAVTEREAARLRQGQKLLLMSRIDLERLSAAGIDLDEADATALALFQNRPVALVAVNGADVQPIRVLNL